MNGITIKAAARCVPEHIADNRYFCGIVDTSEEWITSRTGILRRHHCTGERHADLCVGAARTALERAGVAPEDVGACIVATFTADTSIPSAACRVQRELGLPTDALCFDLNAACTGFLFALHTAQCLLNASEKKYALVVGCDVLSRVTDFTDRGTCILFGDGAGAAVVERSDKLPLNPTELGCYGSDTLLAGPGTHPNSPAHVTMEGQKVFKFAVETVPWCIRRVLEKAGKTVEDVDFFVFHQANARIIDLAAHKCGIPAEKFCKNIHEYGNTSAASIPILLSELQEQGKVGLGSRALLVGFGGGLTWGGMLVEFA